LISIDEWVTPAGQERGDGAARGGIQERAQRAAVDHADRVIKRLVGMALEAGVTVVDRRQACAHQFGDRGPRQVAIDDRLEEFATGLHAGCLCGDRRVIPADPFGPGRSPAVV
jgi:hypothetical protein